MSAADSGLLPAGTLIGDTFRIVRPLGAGGMGQVYIARDLELGRRVALKSVQIPERTDAAAVVRLIQLLRRDAAAAAQLSHPAIVTVYQFGVHDSVPFIVMELVDGETLQSHLDRNGPWPEANVLDLAIALADAMQCAHEGGVIHRDIKPANLMLTSSGQFKILDFGVSLTRFALGEMSEVFESSGDRLDRELPMPLAAGTPAYMAPEQLRGVAQDGRVDIWSTAITLYELLTGQRPYASAAALTPEFRPTWPIDALVSKPTRALIEACLSTYPSKRLGSFTEFGRLARAARAALTDGADSLDFSEAAVEIVDDIFIGRTTEITALDELVQKQGVRVVTVAGEGGIGKTRLVNEWARRSLTERPHVATAIGDTRTRDGILFKLGRALGVALNQENPIRQLSRILESRPGLIVIIDNCEHLIVDLADLVGHDFRDIPSVQWVLTSRIPTEIRGERVMRLGPLSTAGANEARQLFQARAQESESDWTCPVDEVEALDELLSQLDGLPLAIELAAARSKILSPRRILSRLERRFELLRSSKRAAEPRQATLHAAIDWSWKLLTPTSRSVLAQLGVFKGGFSLEDAEDVVDLTDTESEPYVIDVIAGLVDASMLRFDPPTERFHLSMSMGEFVRERLLEFDADRATWSRHAQHMARWGDIDRLEPALGDSNIQSLLNDRDNLRSAARFALGVDDPEHQRWALLCMAASAALFDRVGPYRMADVLYAQAEQHLGSHPDADQLVLGYIGAISLRQGNFDRAEELLTRAVDLAHRAGARRSEGLWKGRLGRALGHGVGEEMADQHLRGALAISREVGDRRSEAAWLTSLGEVEWRHGRLGPARSYFEQALEIARLICDRRGEGVALVSLANVIGKQGQPEEARELINAALAVAREMGDSRNESIWLGNLGSAARAAGEYEEARVHYEGSLAIARDLGDLRLVGVRHGDLGLIALAEEDYVGARSLIDVALRTASEFIDTHAQAEWIAAIGLCAVGDGNLDEARSRLREGRAVAESRDVSDETRNELLRQLAAKLGDSG